MVGDVLAGQRVDAGPRAGEISWSSPARRWSTALRLATVNPAAMTGLSDQAGSGRGGPTDQSCGRGSGGEAGWLGRERAAGTLTCCLRQPLGSPERPFERDHRLPAHRIRGAAAWRPAKKASRTRVICSMTPPVQATGTSPSMACLAAQLGAHQQHKLDQIGRCLAPEPPLQQGPGQGQLTYGRCQRGKVRSGRACRPD